MSFLKSFPSKFWWNLRFNVVDAGHDLTEYDVVMSGALFLGLLGFLELIFLFSARDFGHDDLANIGHVSLYGIWHGIPASEKCGNVSKTVEDVCEDDTTKDNASADDDFGEEKSFIL